MDVQIGTKHYRNIENLTHDKLNHLIQLAQVEIDNYQKAIENYPPERMERYGKPHLRKLEKTKEDIIELKCRLY